MAPQREARRDRRMRLAQQKALTVMLRRKMRRCPRDGRK